MLSRLSKRAQGLTLVELIVVIAVIGLLASIVVPVLLKAVDRSRQRRTMADMRNIATANGMFNVDNGSFANALNDLQPDYLAVVPTTDGWGNLLDYASGAPDDYQLTSYGKDGAAGPAPPAPWIHEPFEPDLILQSGYWFQAPMDSQ